GHAADRDRCRNERGVTAAVGYRGRRRARILADRHAVRNAGVLLVLRRVPGVAGTESRSGDRRGASSGTGGRRLNWASKGEWKNRMEEANGRTEWKRRMETATASKRRFHSWFPRAGSIRSFHSQFPFAVVPLIAESLSDF